MKSCFVADLKDGQAFDSLFLVREKEIRTSPRTGKSWLQVELADRTGRISGKMWDNFEQAAPTFARDDVVRVRGRVKLYNEQKELAIDSLIAAKEADFDLADFLPHTRENVEELYARLRQAVGGVKDEWLRKLLQSIVEDPQIAPQLKRAPAAMTMHHAYVGGLLEHIVSLCGLVRLVAGYYPDLDAGLLLAGAVLHDIGKIDELFVARGFGYTDEGKLLGHITMGAALVRRKIEAMPGFPRPLAVLVEHLILSHHGTHEFGSPQLPAFREAVVLHQLDDLDSKMAAMRASLDAEGGAEDWTERNPALRRELLRAEKFLASESRNSQAAAAQRAGKKS